ncbi:MAG: TonB-dependent receptor [Sphingobium sp.]|nr:TonB-dependent receptor [Sphingobium sp.]
MAQEAAADDSGAIIVTARRREESLIDVPISVTAISGDALQKSGAIDITDISQSVPNVTLETSRGTNSTLTAFIRGVGQQDPVAGFEAGVGLYLDDVYLNRPQAAVLDIYDVERVEVLRGPQGTLYGRNTIGGAVKYVTKRLTTDPTLSVRGTYGSYDQADGVITASTPVGDGTLKFGGALARLSRGGFGDNLTTGRENYNKDVWAGRLSAQADGEGFFVRLTGDYTKDKSEPRGGHRLIPGLFSGAPVLNDVYDTRAGLLDPKQDVEAYGVSLFGEFEVTDGFTLRSITAWRKDNSATPIDFDSLAAVDVDVPAFYNNRQLSQEIQLLVSTGNLNGLIGGYFLDAKARTVFDVRLPGGVTALTFGDVGTETFAIFGDFTYDFTPQLSLSVGGRYTWDERTSQILRRTYLGGGSPFFGGTGTLFATTSDFRGSQTFKEFTPRASLSFKPTQDQTLYASYAKGFKGGGFDPRGQSTACRTPTGGTCTPQQVFDFLSFDPETVETYEVGYKASYGRRLTIALSGFYSDYTDVQVPGSIGTTVNGQQTFVGITTNAGKARIQGIEFEGNLLVAKDIGAPGSRLNLNWAGGYIDAKYKQFIDSRGIDVANRRAFQNTPKWTASGTLAYSIPAFGGDISTSTTVSYRSKSQQFELRTPGLDQAGYALWDASIVWTSEGGRYSLGVHGRNLTDKQYIVSGYNFLSQNPDTGNFNRNAAGALIPTLGREGVLTAYYGNPRQVFVSAGVKF